MSSETRALGQEYQLPMSPPLHRVRRAIHIGMRWLRSRVALDQAGIGLAEIKQSTLTVAGAASELREMLAGDNAMHCQPRLSHRTSRLTEGDSGLLLHTSAPDSGSAMLRLLTPRVNLVQGTLASRTLCRVVERHSPTAIGHEQ